MKKWSLLFGVFAVFCGSYFAVSANVSFENQDDCGGSWTASGGAVCELSNMYSASGRKSMKIFFRDGDGKIIFAPAQTDWSGYKQLRFSLYSLYPVISRFFMLRIEDDKGVHSFGPESNVLYGATYAAPATARRIIINMNEMPKGINLKKIKNLIITCWHASDTTFFIDDMALLTADEVNAEAAKERREKLHDADAKLNLLEKNTVVPAIKKQIVDCRGELAAALEGTAADAEKAVLRARRFITVLEVLKQHGKLLDASDDRALILCSPPTEKVFLDQPYSGASGYFMSAAGHERESFQAVVVPLSPLAKLEVMAGALKGTDDSGQVIGAENVRINPVGYVEVPYSFCYAGSRAGWWPDPLMNNQAIDLSGRIQPYWITVYVPRDSKPGLYRGTLTFRENGKVLKTLDYNLRVRDFALPLRGKLATFMTYSYLPEDTELRRRCYDMLLRYRINPISMYGDCSKTTPAASDLQFCLDRGLNAICLGNLYNGKASDPYRFDQKDFKVIADNVGKSLKMLDEHKCRDMAFINTSDELTFCQSKEVAEYRLEELRKKCSYMKERFPDLRLGAVGRRMPVSRKLIDLWYLAPLVCDLPEKDFAELHAAGAEVDFYWVYEDPSFMLDLPGIAPRICSWMAFKYNAKGIGYYSTYRPWALNCPPEKAPTGIFWSKDRINVYTYGSRRGRVMDGNLFYPSPGGMLLPSIRLANIRDGIEDYEYLALLSGLAGRDGDKLLKIPDSIVTRTEGEYTRSYEALAAYREMVADAVEKQKNETVK